MTGLDYYYDNSFFPHCVAVVCPECEKEAVFNFAREVRIKLKKDVAVFKANKNLEYALEPDWEGRKWNMAIFYPGLSVNSHESITNLPDGYEVRMWRSSYPCSMNDSNRYRGAIICKCGCRRKHVLNWPQYAFYTINYRNRKLWAFTRETAIELRNYVATTDRDVKHHSWQTFLMKIPKPFLIAKARKPIVAKLDKLLEST